MNVQVVSFHCVLKNKLGHVLGTSLNQDVLTVDDSPESPLKDLTESLRHIQKGEKRKIFIPANRAYGFYDLKKIQRLPREDFLEDPVVGEKISFRDTPLVYRVTEIGDDFVTLDANHPLAGQDLIFEVEAIEARTATPEEIFEASEPSNNSRCH